MSGDGWRSGQSSAAVGTASVGTACGSGGAGMAGEAWWLERRNLWWPLGLEWWRRNVRSEENWRCQERKKRVGPTCQSGFETDHTSTIVTRRTDENDLTLQPQSQTEYRKVHKVTNYDRTRLISHDRAQI